MCVANEVAVALCKSVSVASAYGDNSRCLGLSGVAWSVQWTPSVSAHAVRGDIAEENEYPYPTQTITALIKL